LPPPAVVGRLTSDAGRHDHAVEKTAPGASTLPASIRGVIKLTSRETKSAGDGSLLSANVGRDQLWPAEHPVFGEFAHIAAVDDRADGAGDGMGLGLGCGLPLQALLQKIRRTSGNSSVASAPVLALPGSGEMWELSQSCAPPLMSILTRLRIGRGTVNERLTQRGRLGASRWHLRQLRSAKLSVALRCAHPSPRRCSRKH